MLKFDFSNSLNQKVSFGNSIKEIEGEDREFSQALEKIRQNPPGFVRILENIDWVSELSDFKKHLSEFDDFVVLGIGGSALGNTALHQSLKPFHWNTLSRVDREGLCRVFVWDNVDPDFLYDQLQVIDLSRTCFNVISKSGSTAESMAMYLLVRKMLEERNLDVRKHIVFTTDPEKGILRALARKEGFKAFTIPPEVGGRFSVLTSVGLLSALAEGIDITKLLEGAQSACKRLLITPLKDNPAGWIAVSHLLFYEKGLPISVMFAYSNALYYWADWYRQLWAESLGKKLNAFGQEVFFGPTPIKALGVTDQHSQVQLYNEGKRDKVVTFLCVEEFKHQLLIPSLHDSIEGLKYLGNQMFNDLIRAEQKGTEYALTKNHRPNLRVTFPKIDETHIGEFIFTYELATTLFGYMMHIDPFDQPGVELGKEATYALMGRKGYEEIAKQIL